jgi:hypothetical protein
MSLPYYFKRMKKIFILILGIFLATFSFAQKLKLKPPGSSPDTYSKKELAQERKNHNCTHANHYSSSKRLKNYPFNKAAQIKLVSFEGFQIPKIGDSICMGKMNEIETLTLLQIDSLTNLFYNVGFGGTILLIQDIQCYDPRNAILFLDNTGKAFAYIEICFGCQHTVMSDERIDIGDICDQKFELIRKVFSNAGIKYGTEKEH